VLVDSTDEGITTERLLEERVAPPTEEEVEDSEIDENIDIMDLEKRDFNDEDGIEEDPD
jgi:hypothetical protein